VNPEEAKKMSNKILPGKSNKILPDKSNKSLLPNFQKNWDVYLILVIWLIVTYLCIHTAYQML